MRLQRSKVPEDAASSLTPLPEAAPPDAHGQAGLPIPWVIIDGESAVLYEQFRHDLKKQFRRNDPLAEVLLDQLAGVLWRLRRTAGFEAALISWLSHQQSEIHDREGVSFGDHFFPASRRALPPRRTNAESSLKHQHRQHLGRTLEAAFAKSDMMGKLGRYEAHLMRQAERLIIELQRILTVFPFTEKDPTDG